MHMTEYERLQAQVATERAQIDADYEAIAEQHAAELAAARDAARAYRSVLYGASIRGTLDPAAAAELELAEDVHAETIDQ